MPTKPARQEFLGLEFDQMDDRELDSLLAAVRPDSQLAMLVTPNVDHMVRIGNGTGDGADLAPLYRGADICVCDSRILSRLAAFCGVSLPVHPGSDLVRRVFDVHLRPGDRISIVGGDEAMKFAIGRIRPDVDVVQHRPPMGLSRDADAIHDAARFVVTSGARFHFLAVGSPQQEMVAAQARALPGAGGMALCIGAGLEFFAGNLKRAPVWMQRFSLEWLFRLMSEPRRLWRRYLVDGPRIFLLVWDWKSVRKSAGSRP